MNSMILRQWYCVDCDPIDTADNVDKLCKFVGFKGLACGSVKEKPRSIHTKKITRLTKASQHWP